MIDSSMILKLYEINLHLEKDEKKISRKEIKVIVDSIIEQISEYYFQSKPDGIQNVRQRVIKKLKYISNDDDIFLLRSFNLILREHHSAFSKNYADHSSSFRKFLESDLKDFSLALVRHQYFYNDENAKKLRGLLE